MISATAWAVTVAAVLGLLVLELAVAARRSGPVGLRAAIGWSAFYVAAALALGVVLGAIGGWELGVEYFAGYAVEKSLSIDNLFVFVIIVATFGVPAEQQSRALTIGIAAALALRAAFIAAGAALLAEFSVMFAVFGAALLVTVAQLLRNRDTTAAVQDNVVVSAVRRVVPVADRYDGGRVLTRAGGRRVATPMLLVLVALAATDVLFALDSIPVVFGVTQHPFIVFSANAFALLGLRALFFVITGLAERLVYLSAGMALILAFIGVKLILHFVHEHAPAVPVPSTGVSLAVIAAVLAVTTTASLWRSRSRSRSAAPQARRPGARPRGATAPDQC